jgi:hypothetical protein
MAATATLDDAVPFPGYGNLEGAPLIARLRLLSQVELTSADSYERAHRDRPAVLEKLRYLRNDEPLDGYDGLDSDAILASLTEADNATLSRVRAYEMKLRGREEVLGGLVRIRAERGTLQGSTDAAADSPAEARSGDAGRSALSGAVSVGIFGLIGVAAVLMVVLLLILTFVVLTAVAPSVLL